MKKMLLCITTISLVLFFFTSCSENPYSFKEPKDDIERIEIVLAENSLEYTIIKTLSETEKNDFLVEFQEIKFHKYLGDPPKLRGYSIKITYKSGVYEMICYYASEYVESGKIQSLWKRCDEKAFNNLIKLLLEEKSLNH